MTDSVFWHDLAEEFAKLPANVLSISWHLYSGDPGRVEYTIACDSTYLKVTFERLARKAGSKIDEQGAYVSLHAWLEELRRRPKDPRDHGDIIGPEVFPDGTRVFHQLGKISDPVEASISLCIELKMLAMEFERHSQRDSRLPAQPNLELAGTVTPSEPAHSDTAKAKNTPHSALQAGKLSTRDAQVHDVLGEENLRTLTNAQIMADRSIKKRLRKDFKLKAGEDATKSCLDRIRKAKGYPLSREISKKRLPE